MDLERILLCLTDVPRAWLQSYAPGESGAARKARKIASSDPGDSAAKAEKDTVRRYNRDPAAIHSIWGETFGGDGQTLIYKIVSSYGSFLAERKLYTVG